MKRIYIAGPYSSDNVMDVLHNIREGIEVSTALFKEGYAVFCPWLDYHFVLMDKERKLTVNDFYEYSIAWLKVSEVMLVIGDWESSKGTLKEIEIAKELGIPILYDLESLIKES